MFGIWTAVFFGNPLSSVHRSDQAILAVLMLLVLSLGIVTCLSHECRTFPALFVRINDIWVNGGQKALSHEKDPVSEHLKA